MSSQIIVKKNLIVFRRPRDWSAIYGRILLEFGMGMAVRTRMRRELGFTYRWHNQWITEPGDDYVRRYLQEQIHLDFYSESAQSWFQLKYLNL
jgi:hypothetical protein